MDSRIDAAFGIFGCAAGVLLGIWAAHLIDDLVKWKKRHKQ